MRLLLVEDEPALCESLRLELTRAGFAVDTASDGIQGEFMGATEPYDVAVLDLGLPGMPGLEVLKCWRMAGHTLPVLVLTARDAWHERVDGLRAGADDYLGKPFHIEELLARLAALTKRSQGKPPGPLVGQRCRLDEGQQCILFDDGGSEALTGVEFRLLRYLMLHPGRVLSKSQIAEHIYDGDHNADSNVIEVYVNRLRKKLGAAGTIVTRRGQGYVFQIEAEPGA